MNQYTEPVQPAPKITDRLLPLVIRIVSSKKKLVIYKICFNTFKWFFFFFFQLGVWVVGSGPQLENSNFNNNFFELLIFSMIFSSHGIADLSSLIPEMMVYSKQILNCCKYKNKNKKNKVCLKTFIFWENITLIKTSHIIISVK